MNNIVRPTPLADAGRRRMGWVTTPTTTGRARATHVTNQARCPWGKGRYLPSYRLSMNSDIDKSPAYKVTMLWWYFT